MDVISLREWPSLNSFRGSFGFRKLQVIYRIRKASSKTAEMRRAVISTEVETLLCDPTKAKTELGWEPVITFRELVAEMAREDLALAKKDVVIEKAGFRSFRYYE